ncbi:MAG TPA: hypothetical protein VGB70_04415 [Allosphingosinicella sp.]|jgi:hypothetical protein
MAAVAVAIAAVGILSPGTYTNLYTHDALYLLNASYTAWHGFVPHVDFIWQFGGFEIGLIALAFSVFGVSVKAVGQAIAFGYLITAALLWLGCGRQVRLLTFALLLFLITAVCLTRFPFESGSPDIAVQSYAMFYNRLSWALSIVAFSALLLPERVGTAQLIACSTALFLVATTKVTFGVLFVPAAVLIFVRAGGRGLLIGFGWALLLGALAWLLFGYGPSAYLGTITDILDATSDFHDPTFTPLKKLIYVTLFHGLSLFAVAAGLAAAFFLFPRNRPLTIKLLALAAIVLLSLLVTVTTGTFYAVTATTPIFAFAAIVLADAALGNGGEERDSRFRLVFAAAFAFFAVAWATPYFLNYLAGVAKEATRTEQALFTSGPLKGLIIDKPDVNKSPVFTSREHANSYIAARNRLEGGVAWMDDYEWQYLLADGLDAAATLPQIDRRKVVTFTMNHAPFDLGAAPQTSFPSHAQKSAPSVVRLGAIPAEVDTLMLVRDEKEKVLEKHFAASIGRDFVVAKQSLFWDIYVRKPGR